MSRGYLAYTAQRGEGSEGGGGGGGEEEEDEEEPLGRRRTYFLGSWGRVGGVVGEGVVDFLGSRTEEVRRARRLRVARGTSKCMEGERWKYTTGRSMTRAQEERSRGSVRARAMARPQEGGRTGDHPFTSRRRLGRPSCAKHEQSERSKQD